MSANNSLLNGNGQIIAGATVDAPFIVNSSTVVENLNADKVDGVDVSQLLRSDVSSTIESGVDLNIHGKVVIKTGEGSSGELALEAGGTLRIGWFEIKTIGNLLYFNYAPTGI
jgi:hypothetical protein